MSNNQDMPKVLATVFHAIDYFLGTNPEVKILIQGSTKARTRLYQIAINKYFNEVEHKFTIWGFIEDDIELFVNGKNYDGFVVGIK